jgi:hypothetical protein
MQYSQGQAIVVSCQVTYWMLKIFGLELPVKPDG